MFNKALALFFALFFLFVTIALPVFFIPGNDLQFYLENTSSIELVSIALLSILAGILVSVQFELFKKRKQKTAETTLSLFGLFLGSLVSSATCLACFGLLISIIGISAVGFLIEYRLPIIVGSIIVTLATLYISLNSSCSKCNIKD